MTTSADAPSFTGGALPAVTDPSFLKAGRRAASACRRRVRADGLVAVDDDRAGGSGRTGSPGTRPTLRNFDGESLGREASLGHRFCRPAVAGRGVLVLRLTTNGVLRCDEFSSCTHVALFEGAPQAVGHHRVEQFLVPHPKPITGSAKKVGGVTHRLHAARHRNLDITNGDTLRCQHDGLETRTAHLVDGERGDMVAEPAAESRLPRRRLTETGPDDIAHDALVNARWVDSGPSHGLADHERTQVRGGQRLEAAKEFARGCANGGNDNSVVHGTDLDR